MILKNENYKYHQNIEEERQNIEEERKHKKISNLLAQAQMTNNYSIFNLHGINYGDIQEYFGTSGEPGVDQIKNRIRNSM